MSRMKQDEAGANIFVSWMTRRPRENEKFSRGNVLIRKHASIIFKIQLPTVSVHALWWSFVTFCLHCHSNFNAHFPHAIITERYDDQKYENRTCGHKSWKCPLTRVVYRKDNWTNNQFNCRLSSDHLGAVQKAVKVLNRLAFLSYFQSTDHSKCHIHPFTHTFIHWWQKLPCKGPSAHREQFWFQILKCPSLFWYIVLTYDTWSSNLIVCVLSTWVLYCDSYVAAEYEWMYSCIVCGIMCCENLHKGT